MAGTVSGGKKAAQKNIKLHGKDYYREIGRKGGKRSSTGGFASKRVGKDGLTGLERAKLAGTKGGRISKRKPVTLNDIKNRITDDSKLYLTVKDVNEQ